MVDWGEVFLWLMTKQRILWFQDEAKFKAPRSRWEDIDQFTHQLINEAGQPDFEHIVINPMTCANNLSPILDSKEFSCIIDLSGYIGKKIMEKFSAPLIDNIHLSRLRRVSSPRLDGAGFLINSKPEEIENIISKTDLSDTLILDDVSWSGRTILEALKLFRLEPTRTTVGLLAINTGFFAEGKPGAFTSLEEKGINVMAGATINTPVDDGFHLTDFFNHPSIDNIFDRIIHLQELRERMATSVNQEKMEIKEEIEIALKENPHDLFPNLLSTTEVKLLQEEGRLLTSSGIAKDSFFTTNPLNWLLPSFSSRVKSDLLIKNKSEIINALKNLRELTNSDTESIREINDKLMRECCRKGIERF